MGMTIDEAKLNLIDIQKYYNEDMQDCYVYEGFDEEDNETVNIAIETMRKYQKIVDIVSLNGEEFKQCGLKELKEILEVIADGNDD